MYLTPVVNASFMIYKGYTDTKVFLKVSRY